MYLLNLLSSRVQRLLNKHLHLEGSVWIASDIHLSTSIPKTCEAFFNWLTQATEQAQHIILLGDIFNYWVGDDCPSFPLATFQEKLAHATSQLYLMPGNRDFLMGDQLAQTLGAQLLPEVCILTQSEQQFILLHGDSLCTDDKAFMRFRRLTHSSIIQKCFLSLPMSWRQKLGQFARQKSDAKPYTPSRSEVNKEAILELAHHYPQAHTLIHGHTHHSLVDKHLTHSNTALTRWVLSDWDWDHGYPHRSNYIVIEQGQVHMYDYKA